jgi:hypothetical protein
VDDHELRIGQRRLYVLPVDLADSNESGSRAGEPVLIKVRDLLPRRVA